MKNFKKLIPAFAMLLVAAVLLGSSTFAWFSMNTTVTATGMQIQAKSEGGIVISNETVDNWQQTVNASYAGSSLQVIPTSTSDVSNWYHNKSDDINDAKAHQSSGYETISANAKFKTVNGIGFIDSNDSDTHANVLDSDENAYFLKNVFYIKSSSADAITATSPNPALYINKVVVTDSDSSFTSENLNKALRVAVKVGGEVFIYAPFYATDAPAYYVANAGSTTSSIAVPSTGIVNTAVPYASLSTIPGNDAVKSASGTQTQAVIVEIYIYFEGEDTNCKSANITTTLDNLNIEVMFGTTTVS